MWNSNWNVCYIILRWIPFVILIADSIGESRPMKQLLHFAASAISVNWTDLANVSATENWTKRRRLILFEIFSDITDILLTYAAETYSADWYSVNLTFLKKQRLLRSIIGTLLEVQPPIY